MRETRKHIHQYASDVIFGENVNPLEISGRDIERLFLLYDKLVFGNQITRKLENVNSDIRFFIKDDKIESVKGVCRLQKLGCHLKVNISKKLVVRLCNSPEIWDIYGECDRIYAIQYILEQTIIHILMILWGYFNDSESLLSQEGELFHCMLERWFGYDVEDVVSTVSVKEEYSPPIPRGKLRGLLENWENSCYLDSLMMAMFLSTPDYYREKILNSNISQIKYPANEKICSSSSKIKNNVSSIRKLASNLQYEFRLDYERILLGREQIECRDVRKLLADCMPELKGKSGYTSFSSSEIYSAISSIFPHTRMRDIPTLLITEDDEVVTETTRSTFTMWDFMDPDVKNKGEHPLWEEMENKVLVFQNSISPPIEVFNSNEDEYHIVYGPIPGKIQEIERDGKIVEVPEFGEIEEKYSKRDVFEEYIIDGKYRLFAVVMHHGNRPTFEWSGGGHYTAYIRPVTDPTKWYFYNDTGPDFEMTRGGRIPDECFEDTGDTRPEMFFYEKIMPIETLVQYRNDGYVLLFAVDHTEDMRLYQKMKSLSPRYTSKIEGGILVWRLKPKKVIQLRRTLDEME